MLDSTWINNLDNKNTRGSTNASMSQSENNTRLYLDKQLDNKNTRGPTNIYVLLRQMCDGNLNVMYELNLSQNVETKVST